MKLSFLTFTFLITIIPIISHGQQGWFKCSNIDSVELESIYFLDQNNGWLAGRKEYKDSSTAVIYKSTDGGFNWNISFSFYSQDGFMFHSFKNIHFTSPTVGVVVFQHGKNLDTMNLDLMNTTNEGFNWTQCTFSTVYDPSGISFCNNQTGFFYGHSFPFGANLKKSTNFGVTWFTLSSANLNSLFFLNDSLGWGTTPNGRIVRTFDQANTWYYHPHDGYYHYAISFTTPLKGYSLANSKTDSGRMFTTTTGGSVWTLLNEPASENNIRDFLFTSYDTGYCFTTQNKILKTTNAGLNWIEQLSGISDGGFNNLFFISNNDGWILNKNGELYKTTTGGTVGILQNVNLYPEDFLFQNYPNPFNPKTLINYELQITSFAKLKVYDALGNEVATLINQKQNAGRYQVEFDGKNLPSGIYFYRLEIDGNAIDTKRMLLIK